MAYFVWQGSGGVPDTIIEYAEANPGTKIKHCGEAFISEPGWQPGEPDGIWRFCEGCTGVEEECPEHGNGVE